MHLVIAGPPGAGKGTQSALLCRHFDLTHLSTGEVLREAVRLGTPLGRQAERLMSAGELVPDELMLQLVLDWLAEHREQGFLLDGFPRTVAQAEGLEQNGIRLDAIIHLRLDDETIVSRLSGRRVHLPSGRIYHLQHQPPKVPDLDDETGEPLTQREDDRPEAIRQRLQNYRRQTEPVFDYYRQSGRPTPYLQIPGEGSTEEVFERIRAGLEEVATHEGR